MTIAPERPDLDDIDFDVWPDEVKPVSEAQETFYPDVKDCFTTYTVDGTGAPQTVTPAPESAPGGAQGGTAGSWTHTIGDGGAWTVVGFTTLTPENLYDAVRRTQEQERPPSYNHWAQMLEWVCECTPSRGQLLGQGGRGGSYQQVEQPSYGISAVISDFSDALSELFGFGPRQYEADELNQRCNAAVETRDDYAQCWSDLVDALGMIPSAHVEAAGSFFASPQALPHAPALQYGSDALSTPQDPAPASGMAEWIAEQAQRLSKQPHYAAAANF